MLSHKADRMGDMDMGGIFDVEAAYLRTCHAHQADLNQVFQGLYKPIGYGGERITGQAKQLATTRLQQTVLTGQLSDHN